MPGYSADTIRILVSTDNHVGYGESEGVRSDDSWKTFNEVLELAKEHDVDMVLLAGDLFHENHPSRKATLKVMESLRNHCLGDKPCSLEIVGDQKVHFPTSFQHANYVDPNINVSIPVFSIHGNHDDPTGGERTAALDLLHTAGLVNYYGRVEQVDKIAIRPILMHKGDTKLALYGLSNVRDERLFQTFRDGSVTFYNPAQSKEEWYNILSVHQNHTPHTDSSYLPEAVLPANMDLVIWGHEHECKIHPRLNPEKGFKVMQPGSTIATSLIPGESEPKQVAILNVTGKECKVETIRLKTVRPFVYRDIILREEKAMKQIAFKPDNLPEVKKYCKELIEEMIQEANDDWLAQNSDRTDEEAKGPLPLIRLRVEYTAPPGGEYKVEQNQRFSQEYQGRVANINDVIQFHKRKTAAVRRNAAQLNIPDDEALELLSADTIKVSELVREFLTAQSLTMLPQNLFSDAVTQFVDKGDKKAMELFVADSLKLQVDALVVDGDDDSEDDEAGEEDKIEQAMMVIKAQQEERFRKGEIKARKGNTKTLLPKPDDWDSEEQGNWSDYPGAQAGDDDEHGADDPADDSDADSRSTPATRGRGRGSRARGRGSRAAPTTIRKAAPKKSAAASKPAAKGRAKKKPIEEESEEEDNMIVLSDDDEDDDTRMEDREEALFVSQASSAPPRDTTTRGNGARTAPSRKAATPAAKQTTLSFGAPAGTSTARSNGARATQAKAPARRHEPSDDEIDDDDDAFEPPMPSARTTRRR